ncbi:NADP-dependent alcohol dehydrogenase [Protomyces lactucae-debilis]|uniref:NADP-dependent alcohol dehydrogenase n=1 Tax=Protomyces lactucae-debilis TaxID=2754530 RepID=A0A1Y2FMB4_PROLT|nr:NADP-dependent alcohol dehydrogenase [Protomyces lactucae-debilis]ORY85121.1 NADP-dependent alcohol dehydrogenase [Protomyces lactucae-debilis]
MVNFVPEDDEKWVGWLAHDKDAVGKLEFGRFEPKQWTEDDIELQVHYSGICASDLHMLRTGYGWSPVTHPVVVGHEIVGKVIRIGSNVSKAGIKIGAFAGVGAQSGSCLSCEQCTNDRHPYCDAGATSTYGAEYQDGSGKSAGGFAHHWRGPATFATPIEGIHPADAASMQCAGITVLSPLLQNDVKQGSNVGIVGIGGLGHFGIMFAHALGAEVTAISQTHSKEQDAKQMGATHFLATSDGEKAISAHRRSLDLIVCTVNDFEEGQLEGYLSLLKVHGRFMLVGVPDKPLNFLAFPLIANGISIGGSAIGSPKEIADMLELVRKHDIKTWKKIWPMEQVNEALLDMERGNARYRHVLKTKYAE